MTVDQEQRNPIVDLRPSIGTAPHRGSRWFSRWHGAGGEGLIVVCGLMAATQMVWGVLVPVLPAFAESFGVGPADIGMLISGFGLGRIVANIPTGMLSNRVDRRHLMLSGASVVVVSCAASGLAPSFGVLLVLRVITGIAGGVTITTGQSLIADMTETQYRATALSMLQGFQLAGGTIGPALGGLAAAAFGLRAPFFMSGLVAAAFVVWIVSRRLTLSPSEHEEVATTPVEPTRQLMTGNFLAACFVGFAVFFARFGMQQTLLPLLAYQVIGLSVAQLGFLLGAVAVLNVVTVLVLGGLSDRVGRKRVVVPSLLAAAVGGMVYLVDGGTWVFVGATLAFGLAMGIGGPTPMAYVVDVVVGARRGTAIGIYRTFGDLAGIVGPIAIGLLVQRYGFTGAILASVAVYVLAAVVFALVATETIGPVRGNVRPLDVAAGEVMVAPDTGSGTRGSRR